MGEQIKIRTDGAVRVVEFNNPPQNYITHVMLRELYTLLLEDRDDNTVRVLVLTGGIENTFLTHYKVEELLEYRRATSRKRSPGAIFRQARILSWLSSKADVWPWLDRIAIKSMARRSAGEQGIYYWVRCLHILDTYPKPVISAINGLAFGGGCEISLCCDFRYMAGEEQNLIGLPETLLGITPGGTGTPLRLPRIVGEANALEMLLTGRVYRPAEAEAMGLIHRAIASDQLMPQVMKLAHKLARGAPLSQAAIRKSVRQGSHMTWPQGKALEMAGALRAMNSEDADRGMSNYLHEIAPLLEHASPQDRLAIFDRLYEGDVTEFQGK